MPVYVAYQQGDWRYAQARFHAIAKEIGMEARTGGDPRGACAYLIDPNERSAGDGWGNGFAVYS